MTTVIYIIASIFLLGTVIATIMYIPKLKQIFGFSKPPKHIVAQTNKKIALVIPARNESKTIGALLSSIMRQDYPADKFSVNIIVKSPDDPTCLMAQNIGANLFVVPNQTCKGEALDGYFKALTYDQRQQYDAFAIIDADAILADNYVTELNNALQYDKQVYVTNKRVKNFLAKGNSSSWVTDCSALVYPILDELGNTYRSNHNIPLNLCGQGLMVTSEVIEKLNGWPYRSLTEDYELKLDGFLHDFKMMYYPYAVIYTEEVTKHKDSYIRRMRWVKGYSQCNKKYRKAINEKLKNDKCSAEVKFDLVNSTLPIIVYLTCSAIAIVSGIALSIYCTVLNLPYTLFALIILTGLPLTFTYLLLLIYCTIAMTCIKESLKGFSFMRVIKTLFLAPLFILEFVPMYIECQFVPDSKVVWQETARVNYFGKL